VIILFCKLGGLTVKVVIPGMYKKWDYLWCYDKCMWTGLVVECALREMEGREDGSFLSQSRFQTYARRHN